jgi:hypothetical protein
VGDTVREAAERCVGAQSLNLSCQPIEQILPKWIQFLNRADFPGARPMLHGLFPLNSAQHLVVTLGVDKTIKPIPMGKTGLLPVSMLVHALGKPRRHADIKRSTTMITHDVDPSGHSISILFRNGMVNASLAPDWGMTGKPAKGLGIDLDDKTTVIHGFMPWIHTSGRPSHGSAQQVRG